MCVHKIPKCKCTIRGNNMSKSHLLSFSYLERMSDSNIFQNFMIFTFIHDVVNRPGVAGAVLRTTFSLIIWVRNLFSLDLKNIRNTKPLELQSWSFERILQSGGASWGLVGAYTSSFKRDPASMGLFNSAMKMHP